MQSTDEVIERASKVIEEERKGKSPAYNSNRVQKQNSGGKDGRRMK